MNKQKKKKKKSAAGAAENADAAADSVTGVYYQNALADLDGRLAGITSKIVGLDAAIDEADAEYARARALYEDAVNVHVREGAELLAEMDRLEDEKRRMTAVVGDPKARQAREEMVEQRLEQYERVLADVRFESMDVRAKYDGKYDERMELNALLDDIRSVSRCKRTVEENHRDGLYIANKNINIRIGLLSNELEKEFGNMAKMILLDDETFKTRQTINEYYDIIDNIVKTQKQNVMDFKEWERLDYIIINNTLMSTQDDRIQFLKKSIDSMENVILELKKKKEMYLNSQ